jgi:putative transposase
MQRGERLHRKVYENVMAGKYLTLEMAHRAVAAWFDEYAKRPQPRSKYLKGYAPMDLFEPGRGQGVDPVKLTYLMWSKKDATIRASRIGFQGKFYYHEALEGRRHKVEIRYDLQDPGYIAVFENGEFLCIANEQDQVHPMAAQLGTKDDQALLAQYCEIKARQKKNASTLSRQLLEQEVLPAHRRRLERDGVTALGPAPEPIEEKPKKLTAADTRRIEKEVAQYRKNQPAKPDIWADLENKPEAEKYEQLVRYGARGMLIPRQYEAFMRYFEQTGKYQQLEKSGYWENVRTSEIIMHRANSTQTQGAING